MDYIEQYVIDVVSKLRRDNNLRQSDLGFILEVSPSFIGNVENYKNPAKYNLKHVGLLAHYFKLSPKFFVPEKLTKE
jgi:transcriptional regulator with XRE-family HTH domain